MLALHTITTKSWSIEECIEGYARRGIQGISIWREVIQGKDLRQVRKHLGDSGLTGISLVRGGFFTGPSAEEREVALATNREAIAEAEALGLPSIVLVCGAAPGQSPATNREQIAEGISRVADFAAEAGVKLLVEPLHPVYAGDRSAICSLREANQLCDSLNHPNVGIALDVFHVWWEQDLEKEIKRAAKAGRLDAYHICDFKPDMADLLNDRGIMGEGCIDLRGIDAMVQASGFEGFREVEIFSEHWWQQKPEGFLDAIEAAYDSHYDSQNKD